MQRSTPGCQSEWLKSSFATFVKCWGNDVTPKHPGYLAGLLPSTVYKETSKDKFRKIFKINEKLYQGVCWAYNRDQPVNSVGVPMERGKVESWYFIFAWIGRWELVLYLCWLHCKILGKINKMTNWTRTLVSPPCWLTSTPWAINCSTSWWRKNFWWIRLQKSMALMDWWTPVYICYCFQIKSLWKLLSANNQNLLLSRPWAADKWRKPRERALPIVKNLRIFDMTRI